MADDTLSAERIQELKKLSLDTINWAAKECRVADSPHRGYAEYIYYLWLEVEVLKRPGVWTTKEKIQRIDDLIV